MKVEFQESNVYGQALLVDASEFLKARQSEKEFESLAFATDIFSSYYGVDYFIGRREYNAAADALDKTGTVIFTIESSQYPDERWCEITVSNNNRPTKIYFKNELGSMCLRSPGVNLRKMKDKK